MRLNSTVSVHQQALPLLDVLVQNAPSLGVRVCQHAGGATLIDAGIEAQGSLEAGRLIAEICMGGLGRVSLAHSTSFKNWPLGLQVHAAQPVLACLASQYAGWSLSHEKFFALGSGPARAIAQREEIFKELNYQDAAEKTVLVLETNKIPPVEIVAKVACNTQVKPENITFILTPTRSLAGTVQIVARALEVALHKVHSLHFSLAEVVDGFASAPLPPPSPDFLTGMGRTNDAILLGGFAHLFVQSTDAAASQLAQALPSNTSKDFGRPFAEIFKAVNMDFYQIDPLLFSPAKVTVTNLATGKSFHAGALHESLLNTSFN